ncbi:MAG: hypothetical protein U0271_08820 [Polyangiaceae bacterium]
MSRRRSPIRGSRLAAAAAVGLLVGPLVLLTTGAWERTATADQTAPKQVTCTETIPKGAKRPKISERFPGETFSGYEAVLEVTIKHGKGETPLPNGFHVYDGSDLAKLFQESGFIVAELDGGDQASVETKEEQDFAVTTVKIPFVLAPKKSGKHSLTLPQFPLTLQRASGDDMTVCTQLHLVTVVDPTSEEADPKPRPNPPPRPQIEDWPLIRWLLGALFAAILIAALVTWWVRNQMRKPVPAGRPERRLPWEIALEELASLRASPLLSAQPDAGKDRTVLYDSVSDTVRKYLGARYGFDDLGLDGLETTTDEMLHLLRRVRPAVPGLSDIEAFLADCDLVKFARVVPEANECTVALDRAEGIVRGTVPVAPTSGSQQKPPAATPPAPTPPPPQVTPPAFTPKEGGVSDEVRP